MPSRRRFMAYAASAAATMAPGQSSGAAERADVIFRNGTIIPMAGTQHVVEALAVSGSKILAAGSEADLSALRGGATQIVDLQGRTLLPGFIDPHHHTCGAAIFADMLTDVGYTKYPTRPALTAALKAVAARTPPGQWIVACNFDNVLQGGDLSMKELDAISSLHPIFVWYVNMHGAAANDMAFKFARIPHDIGTLPGGGHFGRDAKGKLNGLIYEEPALSRFVSLAVPVITPRMVGDALEKYASLAAAAGNTTLHEPGTIKPEWVYPLVKLSATLDVRLSASLMADAIDDSKAFSSLGIGAKATRFSDSRFSLYGIKIIGDGSNQTKTGAQTKPYLHSKQKGTTNFSEAEMARMCREAKKVGWPVLIHANGDAAIDAALDAIEATYGANSPSGLNRIEHATMVRPDQIDRMKRLGVEPSFLMNHVFLYGAAYREKIFGPERTRFMDPAGDCVKAGVPFTLHSDAPCSPMGPLRLVQTAITRRCEIDKSVIGPDQAITLDQALKAITINAARQIGLEDTLGTLEKGKEADLTILETDPYKTDPQKIMAIKVSETWVGGEKKFG